MTSRWGRTLADEPALMYEWRAHRDPRAVFDPTNPMTEVYAPCCNRKTPADTVVDVRGIPDTIVRGGNFREPEDHDWLCDGCVHLLYYDKTNDWTQSKMMEMRGAPIALVHEVRADEIQRAIARERFANNPPLLHFPMDARDGALRTLAMEHRATVEAELATA